MKPRASRFDSNTPTVLLPAPGMPISVIPGREVVMGSTVGLTTLGGFCGLRRAAATRHSEVR